MTIKKSNALKFLESITGGALTFGELLRSIRLGEEMSMQEFGSLLGISRSHVNQIEKGYKGVTPHRAAAFAQKLGYHPIQFVQIAIEDQLRQSHLNYHVYLKAA